MSKSTKIVYEVLYGADAPGPAGDGSHIARFGSRAAAEAFAATRRGAWGQPRPSIDRVEVPRALALRWGVA
jgi:hypothetical protein